jgi:hypothetical protein
MPRRSKRRRAGRKRHARRGGRAQSLLHHLSGGLRRLGRAFRALRRAPAQLQVFVGLVLLAAAWFALNFGYQVIRKPSELFFPVSGRLNKTPSQTWTTYAPLFRRHSTDVISPELLAALAQVEAMGNPVARTYWRWSLTHRPFEIYRPASSSVGMYQMIDGTFAEARRYCIHRNVVVEQGAWYDPRSCWFNALYTRVIPSHAVELTSAYLDTRVERILSRHPQLSPSLEQKQDLAAVIHLCGATGAARFVPGGFDAAGRCGTHDLRSYLARVRAMKQLFGTMAARSAPQ